MIYSLDIYIVTVHLSRGKKMAFMGGPSRWQWAQKSAMAPASLRAGVLLLRGLDLTWTRAGPGLASLSFLVSEQTHARTWGPFKATHLILGPLIFVVIPGFLILISFL